MAEGFLIRKGGGDAFTTNAITRQVSVRYTSSPFSPGNIIGLTENAVSPQQLYYNPGGLTTTDNYAVLQTQLLDGRTFQIRFQSTWWQGGRITLGTLNTNKTISYSNEVTLASLPNIIADPSGNSLYQPSLITLPDGRVLMFATTSSSVTSNSWRLTAVLFQITGTTISVLNHWSTGLAGNTGLTVNTDMEMIDNNKVLVVYSDDNNRPAALVLTINGNTITRNNPFLLSSTSGVNTSLDKISENKFISAYRNSSSNPNLQILVYSSGDTVTMGTNYIPTTSQTYNTRVIAYNENKIGLLFDHGPNARFELWNYSVDGGGLNYITQNTSLVSFNTSMHYAYGSRWMDIAKLNGNRIALSMHYNRSTSSSTWRQSLIIYNHITNSVIYNTAGLIFGDFSSGDFGTTKIQVYNPNNLVFYGQIYNSNTNRHLIFNYTITNTDMVVDANPAFTNVRGFCKTGGSSDSQIEVFVSNQPSNNPLF
jgi:hypothetical protein